SAKANLAYQQSNYDRQNQLFNVGAISKAALETALYQYQSAKQNVSSLSAQLSSAQRNLSFAEIYSPIDGTVLSRSVSEGQTVASSFSTPTLFSIAKDLTKMQVQASVNEADIGNVIAGQRVDFTVDAFPDDTFSGIVKEVRLRPSVSSNVVSYTTIIDAPNPSMKLKPGMTASITIYTKEIKDVLLLTAKAISFNPDSIIGEKYFIQKAQMHDATPPLTNDSIQSEATPAFVWVKKDSSLIQKRIWLGLDDETSLQVLVGLAPEDEVITGYQQLEKTATKKSSEKSPFLPQRPGGNNKKNNSGPPPQ
ncbi:MAG TPA: efflux RND transporter periplasmic adaptor subunit, partial [Chitinophagaceae bacterium]|nr:efflux RND transporter periplasmic adaptor subunit [Chitinophagaceae bacterium]